MNTIDFRDHDTRQRGPSASTDFKPADPFDAAQVRFALERIRKQEHGSDLHRQLRHNGLNTDVAEWLSE